MRQPFGSVRAHDNLHAPLAALRHQKIDQQLALLRRCRCRRHHIVQLMDEHERLLRMRVHRKHERNGNAHLLDVRELNVGPETAIRRHHAQRKARIEGRDDALNGIGCIRIGTVDLGQQKRLRCAAIVQCLHALR